MNTLNMFKTQSMKSRTRDFSNLSRLANLTVRLSTVCNPNVNVNERAVRQSVKIIFFSFTVGSKSTQNLSLVLLLKLTAQLALG